MKPRHQQSVAGSLKHFPWTTRMSNMLKSTLQVVQHISRNTLNCQAQRIESISCFSSPQDSFMCYRSTLPFSIFPGAPKARLWRCYASSKHCCLIGTHTLLIILYQATLMFQCDAEAKQLPVHVSRLTYPADILAASIHRQHIRHTSCSVFTSHKVSVLERSRSSEDFILHIDRFFRHATYIHQLGDRPPSPPLSKPMISSSPASPPGLFLHIRTIYCFFAESCKPTPPSLVPHRCHACLRAH